MDYWMLLPFLVLLLPALLLVGIGRRQRGKLFSQARSQFPELGDGRHARFAGIYRLEDLDVNQLRGSGARTGFVTLTADALQVYRVLPGGRWERRSFLPRTVRVGLIESGHLSTILPSLIRVVAPTEAFYLTALSRDVRPDGKQTRAWFSELDSRIPAEPVAGVPSRPGFASNLVLWGLLILLTSASVFAVGSALRMSPEGAPKLLVRGQGGEVLVASAVELFRLDEAGALLERIPLADLGLHDGITRMVRAPDGSYLTGDLGGGSLKRCDLAARSCETLPGFADGTERFVKAFDFALDGPGSRIYAVDTSRHRLLEMGLDGRDPRVLLGPGDLCFPQQALPLGDRLYVVDTNRHRVVWLDLPVTDAGDPDDQRLTVAEGRDLIDCPAPLEHPWLAFFHRELWPAEGARPFPGSERGSVWPVRLGRDATGAWWLINAGEGMGGGDLLRFDDLAAESPRVVPLEGEANPTDLLIRDQDVLVADYADYRIRRFDLAGAPLADFGDQVFLAALAEGEELRAEASLSRLRWLVAAAFLLPIGILWGIWVSRRRLELIAKAHPQQPSAPY